MGTKRVMTLKELQETELDIMRVFHDFCEKHGLRYYLAGGTLLGAIRHKGFIPWDDDIDVCMPHPDYLKLVELSQNGMLDEFRYLDTRLLNKDCPSSMIRICDNRTEVEFTEYKIPYKIGCWIDIYSLDGLSDIPKERSKQFRQMRVAMDLFLCCLTKFGNKRRNRLINMMQYCLLPALPVIRAVGYQRYLDWLDRIATRYSYDEKEYVGVLEGRGGEKETMRKSDMEPRFLVDFEGEKFYTMANYDAYLTNLYGDYMTPPREEDRVSRHVIDIFWKENYEQK